MKLSSPTTGRHQRQLSLRLSPSQLSRILPPLSFKCQLSPAVGAVGAVVAEVGAVGTSPTEEEIIIVVKIKRRLPTLPLQAPTSLTKEGQSILTYRRALRGRALSTGRKGGALLIVATPWSVSGKMSSLLVHRPSANLVHHHLK